MKKIIVIAILALAAAAGAMIANSMKPQIYVVLPEEETTEEKITLEELETETVKLSMEEELAEICEEYGIEPEYLLAIGMVESNLNPDATNGNNYGMFQINESNFERLFEELGQGDLRDYRYNAECACWLLRYYLDKGIDNYYYLAMAYEGNLGYANPLWESGQVDDYAVKVMDNYHNLKGEIAD